MTAKPSSTPRTSAKAEDHWHERHQQGAVGGYGTYGGAQDQIPEVESAAPLDGQQPRVPVSPRSGERRHDEAEPYRQERVQGGTARGFEPSPGNPASDGQMSGQFAGADAGTPATPAAREHGGQDAADKEGNALATHLTAQLAKSGFGDAQVKVSCANGNVALTGSVADAGTKAAITQVIRHAAGNARIDDGIEVRGQQGQSAQGQGLAAATDEYAVLNGRQV